MSGNMSFIDNNNSGSRVAAAAGPANDASVIRGRRNGTLGQLSSTLLGGGGGGRSSLSFSDVGSPSSSFQDGGEQRFTEAYQDKDVWGTRIILSALEEITFTEAPYPKLSPEVKDSFQKFLLAVNGAVSNANPFVEKQKSASDSSQPAPDNVSLVEDNNGVPKPHGTALEIPREVMEVLEGIPTETKIVLRSIISNYVRGIATNIIETWKPILEAEGITLPRSSKPTSSQGVVKKRVSQGTSISLDDYDLEGCLQVILDKMQSTQKESKELDLKLRDLMKARDEQILKYERDIKIMNQINLAILKEKTAMEDPEFVNNYMDILELENKVIEEQLRLEQLKLEVDGSSEDEQKEREELYNKVRALYDKMDAETREMEEKISNYKSLGPEYLAILEEYKNIEAEITMKEWVKEQLVNGPHDDSLLNDSL